MGKLDLLYIQSVDLFKARKHKVKSAEICITHVYMAIAIATAISQLAIFQ